MYCIKYIFYTDLYTYVNYVVVFWLRYRMRGPRFRDSPLGVSRLTIFRCGSKTVLSTKWWWNDKMGVARVPSSSIDWKTYPKNDGDIHYSLEKWWGYPIFRLGFSPRTKTIHSAIQRAWETPGFRPAGFPLRWGPNGTVPDETRTTSTLFHGRDQIFYLSWWSKLRTIWGLECEFHEWIFRSPAVCAAAERVWLSVFVVFFFGFKLQKHRLTWVLRLGWEQTE